MRILFLFFLLVNMAFFYWQTEWREQTETPHELLPLAMPQGVQRLQLLSERSSASAEQNSVSLSEVDTESDVSFTMATSGSGEPELDQGALKIINAPAKETKQESTPAPPPVCYTLGPFQEKADADKASKQLTEAGIPAEYREEIERTSRGFWIFLPPFKSYAAANEIATQLRGKGIKDLFIMGKGEHQNAISLGLYRSKSAAEERFDQVKSLGFPAELDEQFRETTVVWLALRISSADDEKIRFAEEIAGKTAKLSLTQKACE